MEAVIAALAMLIHERGSVFQGFLQFSRRYSDAFCLNQSDAEHSDRDPKLGGKKKSQSD